MHARKNEKRDSRLIRVKKKLGLRMGANIRCFKHEFNTNFEAENAGSDKSKINILSTLNRLKVRKKCVT